MQPENGRGRDKARTGYPPAAHTAFGPVELHMIIVKFCLLIKYDCRAGEAIWNITQKNAQNLVKWKKSLEKKLNIALQRGSMCFFPVTFRVGSGHADRPKAEKVRF